MIVSIIIPVFNTKYEDLLKCLDSILAQTFPNFEVVIIDDGSEDYYGNRLDELVQLDSRISVFHKKNEEIIISVRPYWLLRYSYLPCNVMGVIKH